MPELAVFAVVLFVGVGSMLAGALGLDMARRGNASYARALFFIGVSMQIATTVMARWL